MGNAAGEEMTPPRVAAVDSDGATTRASEPPVEQERHRPAPLLPAAAGAAGGSAAARHCGEEEQEVDDEQVERFYALLANIRALRGLYRAGESGSPAAGRGRKRAREAEAPWRPAFRMEDFEEEVSQVTGDARCAAEKQQGTGGARRPAAVARARAGAVDHEEDEDKVAEEARGRSSVAASQRRGDPCSPDS